MKKILFWSSVWFVVLCMGFALQFWLLVVNRAGIEVTAIDLVWFNPQWDGRGDDSFIQIDFWESVLWFIGLWLGGPVFFYHWLKAESERDAKEWKKRQRREERIEDYAEALRRHEEKR